MLTIWNRDEAYLEKYFSTIEGYYNTGDSGLKDEDGYFYVMSSISELILRNWWYHTAGHRLSTGEMEEALQKHDSVAEAIVVGVKD